MNIRPVGEGAPLLHGTTMVSPYKAVTLFVPQTATQKAQTTFIHSLYFKQYMDFQTSVIIQIHLTMKHSSYKRLTMLVFVNGRAFILYKDGANNSSRL